MNNTYLYVGVVIVIVILFIIFAVYNKISLKTICKWAFRIFLYGLIIILIKDNIQNVRFNFYGIYLFELPMAIFVLGFFTFGIFTGLLINFIKIIQLKAKIRKLEKSNINHIHMDNAKINAERF